MKNQLFCFWESKELILAYLELCKKAWIKYIPDLEVVILNYNNLEDFIGGVYDIEKLKNIFTDAIRYYLCCCLRKVWRFFYGYGLYC